jgi:SAM-dependent methyltransferase
MSESEVSRIHNVYAARAKRLAGSVTADPANPGNLRFREELRRRLTRVLAERFPRPLSACRALDVGCGWGGVLGWLHEAGVPAAGLFGVDLLPASIAVARERFPDFTLRVANAERLEFDDGSFDLVVLCTVFSSIFDQGMAENLAREIDRVLAPGGAVVWYDIRYPNPSNPQVRRITKARVASLFPGYTLELERLTLLPPLARRLGGLTDVAYPVLASIPLLCTHHFGLLRPPRR